MSMRRSTRGGGFGLLLLAGEVMRLGTNNIPPVTLATVVINAVIYMRLIPSLPSVSGACTSYSFVIDKRQWYRLVTSSLFHLDDMHLYFNMASFLWKGRMLEQKYGSRRFAIVLTMFALLSQVGMVALNKMLAMCLLENSYLYTCAAGFSAVVFALKVLTTHHSDGQSYVMNFLPVPSQYACWVELVVIQILVPNASFTGHLAGILVGVAFVSGPLKIVMKVIDKIITGSVFSSRHPYRRQQAATGTRGSTEDSTLQNSTQDADNEDLQSAIQNSLRYQHDEDLSQALHESLANQEPPTYGWRVPDNNPEPPYPVDASVRRRRSEPSAPVLPPTHHSSPPYPSNDSMPPPHPVHDAPMNTAPYPRSDAPLNNAPYPVHDAPLNNAPYPRSDAPLFPPVNSAPYPPSDVPMHHSPSIDSSSSTTSTGGGSAEQSRAEQLDEARQARLRRFTTEGR